MKLYYVTQNIMPNEQDHFLAEDMTADMVTPLYLKAQVIDWTQAKRIKELHGKGFTAMVEVDTVFGLTRHMSYVDDMGCTHAHMYYMPALS